MKKKIEFLIKHPLVSGGSITFLSTFVGLILNYIFNFIMARFLSVPDYGLLIALLSFVSIFSIFPVSLSGIFAKFAAFYHAKQNKSARKQITIFGLKLNFCLALVIFLLLLFFKNYILKFLNLNNQVFLFFVYGSIFFSIVSSLPLGIFQGEMKFLLLSVLANLIPFLKVILGILFVLFGLKVGGALLALFLAFSIPSFISLTVLLLDVGFFRINQEEYFEENFKKDFFKYGSGFFIASLGMTLLSNTDIILVRHFFNPFVSGQYAALSLMGKAIFFFTSPISFAFFPLAVYKKEKKERLFGTLVLAFLSTLLISFFLSIFYFIFPSIVIKFFFPIAEYKSLSSHLGIFSLYILIYSVMYLMNSFLLSVGRTSIYKITLAAAVFQIMLMFLFHKTLYEIIFILFSISFLLLIYFLIYYAKYEKD